MADAPQVHAQFGNPNQLPYGLSTALNRAAAQGRQMAAPQAPPPPTAGQSAPEASFRPPSDDASKYLYSGTQNPQEAVTAGMTQGVGVPPPANLLDHLPLLMQAAQAPGASPQVQALAQ